MSEQAPSKDKLTDVDLDALIRAYNAGGIAHGFVPEVYRCLVELKQMRNSPEPAAPIQQAARAFVAALDADAIAELVSTRGYQAEWNVLCDALRTAHEPGLHHWWCETCQRQVENVEVTYDETHDLRSGGCGQHVFARPSPPPRAGLYRDMLREFEANALPSVSDEGRRAVERFVRWFESGTTSTKPGEQQ